MATTTVLCDDQDSSISYAGGRWTQSGFPGEYMETTTFTLQKGATARLTFSGTRIGVYGTIVDKEGVPISSYGIDGGNTTIFHPGNILQATQYRRQFFQSNELTEGSHTLVITTLADNAFFILDYFAITLLSDGTPPISLQSIDRASPSMLSTNFLSSTQVLSPTSSSQGVASATTASSGIATASSGLNSTAPYVTTSPVASSKVDLPLSLIIGGTLGGLALLIVGFIAFMFFRRRANDRSRYGEPTLTRNSSLWTSIPRANFDVVATHATLTEKRPLVPVPSPNRLQDNTPSPGLHAHGASASLPSESAPGSTGTSNQVSDSTTTPPDDLQLPQYEE